MKQNLVILGSTGSIGTSTLKVLDFQYKQDPTSLQQYHNVYGLFANRNFRKLAEQVAKYKPKFCGLFDKSRQIEFERYLADISYPIFKTTTFIYGEEEIISFITSANVDKIVNAIVGFAGLKSSLASIAADKTLLLANKESLVVGGHLIKQLLKQHDQARLIPIDSEHNAIFQSLPPKVQQNICNCNLDTAGISRLLLTGSGGPFLTRALEDFKYITAQSALKHPNWSMGPKVTIDSATMMNKGLEFIEAAVLYNCRSDQILTVIHPQSIVHSGVEYLDSSLIVQMGPTDMCVPIAYALNYPYRNVSSVQSLDLFSLQGLTFKPVDPLRYPNFILAVKAFEYGFNYTCALNAANEVAVNAFLHEKIGYLDIYRYNRLALEYLEGLNLPEATSYQAIYKIDQSIRKAVTKMIAKNNPYE